MFDHKKQFKSWCFTINSTTEIDAENIVPNIMELSRDEKKFQFMIFQLEKGKENGVKHIQGYCQLAGGKNGRVLSKVKELFGITWIHLEPAKGSKKQNIEYCSKQDTRIGETYIKGDTTSQGDRNDLNNATNMICQGKTIEDVALNNPEVFVKFNKGLEKLKFVYDKKMQNECKIRDIKCIVYYGTGRTGKTWKANAENPRNYRYDKKNSNNLWFDGYDNEDVLILEEFDGSIPIERLFRLLDGEKQLLEIKGGFTTANWTKVIITTNIPICKWYPNIKSELRDSLIGRLSEYYHFTIPAGIPSNKERYKHVTITKIELNELNVFGNEIIPVTQVTQVNQVLLE